MAIEQVGDLAAHARLTLHELSSRQASLEEAYMTLTGDAVEHRGRDADQDDISVSVA